MLWAAGGGDWHGAGVFRSTDGGATWVLSKLSNGQADEWLAANPEMAAYTGMAAAPPAPYTGEVKAIWSLHHAGGVLYAGTKPAMLFASHDHGATWERVQGLSDHPSGPSWEPGGAGLVLHTILSDPSNPHKLWVGISAAGVFATEDGGATWDRRNRRANDGAEEDHGACGHEVGFCVHNMVRAPGPLPGADLIYQQNHHGVFRSPDGGRNWVEITAGLPSNFGFPIAVHPRDPQTLWVLPLNGDTKGRFPPDASAKVWRSRDGGGNWQALGSGLPAQNCFFTVLRQSMATDHQSPAGVYFGTNSGSVFATADEGDSWTEIARHLPTVLSVEVLGPQAG
ncbi:hypothetical protein MASR2M74_06780 [Paracoccaceae bacterium]